MVHFGELQYKDNSDNSDIKCMSTHFFPSFGPAFLDITNGPFNSRECLLPAADKRNTIASMCLKLSVADRIGSQSIM